MLVFIKLPAIVESTGCVKVLHQRASVNSSFIIDSFHVLVETILIWREEYIIC